MLVVLLKGLLIGFAIAAPIGPNGILCIQRSLHSGFKMGLMTGLGVAIAHGTYGLVACFGLTSFSSLLITHQLWVRYAGGLFLLYLGAKLFFTVSHERLSRKSDHSSWHAMSTTYLLTLSNPVTVLAFIAIFAGLGLGTVHPSYIDAIILVLGITTGSAAWWVLLSSSVALVLRHRLSTRMIRNINRLSGFIIFSFGLLALLLPHF